METTISLDDILELVGRLDDKPGSDTPRERFRKYLEKNIVQVGRLRDYVEACLREPSEQHARALQDLVNYLGRFLGFQVTYGRYQGAPNEVGFDGLWESPTGFCLVIEVKTTETYPIKTSTLIGYIDKLISDRKIPDWDSALGLYVVGKPDPEIKQLENSIIAEKRTDRLRIISVEALLTLTEMLKEYGLTHEDVLSIIRPSGPKIDVTINLMVRLIEAMSPSSPPTPTPQPNKHSSYFLTPVRDEEGETAEERIQKLVGKERIYAFGEKTAYRKKIKPGDRICFYAAGVGVIADAVVAGPAENKPHPAVKSSHKYSWVFPVDGVRLYPDRPVEINAELRSQLDAFKERNPNDVWSWFVQATHPVTRHDFELLTRRIETSNAP